MEAPLVPEVCDFDSESCISGLLESQIHPIQNVFSESSTSTVEVESMFVDL